MLKVIEEEQMDDATERRKKIDWRIDRRNISEGKQHGRAEKYELE